MYICPALARLLCSARCSARRPALFQDNDLFMIWNRAGFDVDAAGRLWPYFLRHPTKRTDLSRSAPESMALVLLFVTPQKPDRFVRIGPAIDGSNWATLICTETY